MLQCNRKKHSFPNNANTWNIVWGKKKNLTLTQLLYFINISEAPDTHVSSISIKWN